MYQVLDKCGRDGNNNVIEFFSRRNWCLGERWLNAEDDISSNKVKVTQLCPTLWDPGQNAGVRSLFLLQGNLPHPGIEPSSPTLQADSFTSWVTKEAHQVEANVKARVSIGRYKETLISCNSRAQKAKVQLQDLITGITGLQSRLNSQTRLSSMPRSWPQLEKNRILRHWMETSSGMHCCCCWVAKSCSTLCDPMDCSLPGSSVYGTSQARILEWAAISFSRGCIRTLKSPDFPRSFELFRSSPILLIKG